MSRYRKIIFYLGVFSLFSFVIYSVIVSGEKLESGRDILHHTGKTHWTEIFTSLEANLEHPLTLVLGQIIVILIAARLFGWLAAKLHQPVVIGEIIAGIVLGPSLVGLYFPGFSQAIFPAGSLGNLNILSQIGLILFMFMVGMELDIKLLKKKVNDAIIISHTGILFSFSLGITLAYFIYQSFAPQGISFLPFGLFFGISLSFTAFPVLARIIQEKGMHKTPIGNFVITCAAVDDITAWSLLAIVIAIVKAGSFVSAIPTIILSVLYVFLMLKVIRPFLARIGELHSSRENLTKPVVAIFFMVLLLSACSTELIGIHAIFGGFMAGAVMPDNVKFRNIFIDKVEDVALILFLPLFFVYTGLRTQIGLLNEFDLWKTSVVIILVAISGKFFGASIAARFTGHNLKDSLTTGVLMNSRGLVELVVLNIGFDLGVFSAEIFAMMVIMTLVTTFMTAPVLDLIERIYRKKTEPVVPEPVMTSKFRMLLSFGNPVRGKSMIRLAGSFVRKTQETSSITALHLSPVDDMFNSNIDDYEKESFIPLMEESQELNLPVTTSFSISNNIEADIAELANHGDFDLLVVGVGQSIFEGSFLGKMLGFTAKIINPAKLFYRVTGKEKLWHNAGFDERLRSILSRTDIPVGVFIDKKLTSVNNVLIPVMAYEDPFMMVYAQMLITNSGSKITLYDPKGLSSTGSRLQTEIKALSVRQSDLFEIIRDQEISEEFLDRYDLMLVSVHNWAKLIEDHEKWLFNIPSTLILTS